jgi:hypothetical protein
VVVDDKRDGRTRVEQRDLALLSVRVGPHRSARAPACRRWGSLPSE